MVEANASLHAAVYRFIRRSRLCRRKALNPQARQFPRKHLHFRGRRRWKIYDRRPGRRSVRGNDACLLGSGSLRDAVSAGNRTVVFKVAGVIQLKSPLKILGDNLTIAGQTAPGDGITVIGYPTTFDGNNLIIRYMRFRLGDMNETEADSFGGRYKKDILIDHSSFSWFVDEVLSPYGNENVTVQWSSSPTPCILADTSKADTAMAGYGAERIPASIIT